MSLPFVGEKISVILPADADNRVGVQISLLYFVTGEACQISGQLFNKKLSFYFHCCAEPPFSI